MCPLAALQARSSFQPRCLELPSRLAELKTIARKSGVPCHASSSLRQRPILHENGCDFRLHGMLWLAEPPADEREAAKLRPSSSSPPAGSGAAGSGAGAGRSCGVRKQARPVQDDEFRKACYISAVGTVTISSSLESCLP